jgi:hypothetical protein
MGRNKRRPKAPTFAEDVSDLVPHKDHFHPRGSNEKVYRTQETTEGLSPHKDHFHDDSGAKVGVTGNREDGSVAPDETTVENESTNTQKTERRRRRKGTGVLDTMIRRRGGSSSTASKSGQLL